MTALGEETVLPDEPAVIADLIAFLKAATDARHPDGSRRRFNQGRHTACVDAEFAVLDSLPQAHRVGLFARPHTYSAWIRFANAASAGDREPDIRGMAIRVAGVAGENLTPGSTVQDFVLNSHPVMMAPDAREFLDLLRANEAGGLRRALYFLAHPKALSVALASRGNPTCHLDIPYWSATPYAFGNGRAVKYVVVPSSPRRSPKPARLTDTYLQDALRARLTQGEATFDFMVQLQTDPRRMPIEDATVEWRREESPYLPVARIRVPAQAIDEPDRMLRCEQAAFNPWNCLAEHRPLGSMNRARRDIYRTMAAYRAAASV